MTVQLQPYEREVQTCEISSGTVHVGASVRYTRAHIERLRLVLPQLAKSAETKTFKVHAIVQHLDGSWSSLLIEPSSIPVWVLPNTLEHA